jgi:glycosyltransferase involved in cell wall biosynthesis
MTRFPRKTARRLRILHLAFDDHRRPGSGGGAIRNREINRRLAVRHDVTAVTVSYRGSRERVEDGVRYVPAGLPLGYYGSILTYFAVLPIVIWRHRSDLVVEDFAAPFGSALVPLWTRRPVVAHVQWLDAAEKAKQYHLPFHVSERWGILLHRVMIAVSEGVAQHLRAVNRRAEVMVLPNAVEEIAWRADGGARRGDVLYLGRLEVAGKGLDLLLQAFARIAGRTDCRLLIAGDGPDGAEVLALARKVGVEDRVEMLGRVDGASRFDLLASVRVLCVPSRHESFGLVALEAMACATPVVAFDIPCLREVVDGECALTVPPFDVGRYADAMLGLVADPERCRRMGEAGRRRSRRFNWADIAREQERIYARAVGAEGEDGDRVTTDSRSSVECGPAT